MGNTVTRQINSGNSEYDDERVDEKYVKCTECVRIMPVFSITELKPGDHIVFRNVNYDHHGIVCLVNRKKETIEIIEVSNTLAGASPGIASSSSPLPAIILASKANLRTNKKTLNFKTEKIALIYYQKRFDGRRTVERAKHYADTVSFHYNLFSNNCEHFATYCATGYKFSLQSLKVKLSLKLFWQGGFSALGNEKARYKILHDSHFICDSCYRKYEHLLSVESIPITSAQDVNSGDIIRFSYFKLLHDAVVLNKKKYTEKAVVLTIAHYAFCGFRDHRTIKEEIIEFQLDGECFKVDYKSPRFKIRPPHEVVRRARHRIGEQFHVLWSFDTNHFARWCKLE